MEGVGEAVVAGVAGQYDLLLARGPGDRAGTGVVLARSGICVAMRVVAELAEHPGTRAPRISPSPGWER